MKICFYSPYLPHHFGGGERYLFNCALSLACNHQIDIAIKSDYFVRKEQIISNYEKFIGQKLDKLNFISSPLGTKSNFITKLFFTKNYDRLFYITDGSLFFSLASKNILHIQIPFQHRFTSIIDRLKLKNWQIKITNSLFTKKQIEKNWQTHIDAVHYPVTINQSNFNKVTHKKKIILGVGRFFRHLHSKRQDILIDIFYKFKNQSQLNNWQLVLIGMVEDAQYFSEIKAKINQHDNSIKLLTNVDNSLLRKYLQEASFFWHAAGYMIDEDKNPQAVEHFGISTVEAMASNIVPLVHAKGGQKEILTGKLSYLLWHDQDECVKKCLSLIKDEKKYHYYQKLAQERAFFFSKENFDNILNKIIK